MSNSRRHFLKTIPAFTGSTLITHHSLDASGFSDFKNLSGEQEDNAFGILTDNQMPVLKSELFPDPVLIDRLELLRYEDNFICRVSSTIGAEGLHDAFRISTSQCWYFS